MVMGDLDVFVMDGKSDLRSYTLKIFLTTTSAS